ncbi:MAG: ATP-binding cassette domain-containing protein [Caenispirillum sp.]|nr:ATP-binding cassette domain-containing protein [Caenispirillum sp.]
MTPASPAAPLLDVRDLSKSFKVRPRLGERPGMVHALDGISLTVGQNETVGLVGESGCGKSTAGRAILRLIEPDQGTVTFEGEDVRAMSGSRLRALRKHMQIIFQDPYASLNPRRTVYQTLAEALTVHRICPRAEIPERVAALLEDVGLPAEAAPKYPHEFSGGQRQRIGIARALSVAPRLIVADEAVSALDVSIQAQVLKLLGRLKEEHGLSYLFITHDLGVVRYFCQTAAVMYLGRIVEAGPVGALFDAPLHPYTEMLRNASPVPDPVIARQTVRVTGEVPSPLNPPSGCHFHPRCPHATAHCREVRPVLREVGGGRRVACHLHAA